MIFFGELRRPPWFMAASMGVVVGVSNLLVHKPVGFWGLEGWLTWAAFTYPLTFLVNDLTNRGWGLEAARGTIFVGVLLAFPLSWILSDLRTALSSCAAFWLAQTLDALVFSKLRRWGGWWRAPLGSTLLASTLDTWVFFGLAFGGSGVSWWGWAIGDLCAKGVTGLGALWAYGMLRGRVEWWDKDVSAGDLRTCGGEELK